MSDRDRQILELTGKGMSAETIRRKLGLTIGTRAVQRVQQRHLGKVSTINNSRDNQIPIQLRPYVIACLAWLGKDPQTCEICEAGVPDGCQIHHTKYKGATIYDLMYICGSCNKARANRGLA